MLWSILDLESDIRFFSGVTVGTDQDAGYGVFTPSVGIKKKLFLNAYASARFHVRLCSARGQTHSARWPRAAPDRLSSVAAKNPLRSVSQRSRKLPEQNLRGRRVAAEDREAASGE